MMESLPRGYEKRSKSPRRGTFLGTNSAPFGDTFDICTLRNYRLSLVTSGRFAIATHALALLAMSDEEHASREVASSINTHPVFLRRVMAALCRAGIVEAREGRGGGYRLARPAERVSLSEVYEAVEPEGALGCSPCEPNAECPVGAGIRAAFEEAAQSGHDGLLRGLAERTVADVARRAVTLGKREARGPGVRKKRAAARA